MQYREQQRMLDELKKYERNFTSKENDEYKMFIKRQKDDEDFDSISFNRLKDLHKKYIKAVDPSKYDYLFKKKDDSQENKEIK